MKTFKQFLAELKLSELRRDNAVVTQLVELLEHEVYKAIRGTRNSYREDSANTNTLTNRHSHAYARTGGKGSELYAVNVDGRGHDGSSGKQIPDAHADFFRGKGYRIGPDNILESLNVEELVEGLG
jgi:hypothetical protein